MPIHSSVEGYILSLPFLLLFPLLWFAEEIKNCCDNSIFSLLFSEHGTRNGWGSQDVMEWSLMAMELVVVSSGHYYRTLHIKGGKWRERHSMGDKFNTHFGGH